MYNIDSGRKLFVDRVRRRHGHVEDVEVADEDVVGEIQKSVRSIRVFIKKYVGKLMLSIR